MNGAITEWETGFMVKEFVKNTYCTLKSLFQMAKSKRVSIKYPQRVSDEIFVIANGPSVKDQISKYPNVCLNHDVMCMNYIANSDFYKNLRPKYYILADPNDFMPGDMCSKEVVEARTEGLDNIITKTSWEMCFFIPDFARESRSFLEKIRLNENIDIEYYSTNQFNGFEKIKYFLLSKGLVSPGSKTVLIPAIYLAIIMGYKKIYLFGAEHSWMHDIFCDDNNRIYTIDKHSYGTEKRFLYKDSYGTEFSSMYDELSAIRETFRQHIELQGFAKKMGVNIYNVTPGSLIDVYERKKLEEVL